MSVHIVGHAVACIQQKPSHGTSQRAYGGAVGGALGGGNGGAGGNGGRGGGLGGNGGAAGGGEIVAYDTVYSANVSQFIARGSRPQSDEVARQAPGPAKEAEQTGSDDASTRGPQSVQSEPNGQ